MFMSKRGLSDVVTVSLIILLAIAAVVIVWTFVRPTLESTGKEIASGNCLAVELKPISCSLSDGTVRLINQGGQITVNSVKLIYYDNAGVSVGTDDGDCNNIAPAQTQSCLPDNGIPAGAVKASVAAVLGDKVCPISTTTVPCI
ncbi:MAG: hypothetical protein Q7S27_00270 [Nanoarchaeota archaeon]|nr:hypothetical protein [Nanoarchaeota archaeon]